MESDVQKMSDEELCDNVLWATRKERGAISEEIARRFEIMRKCCEASEQDDSAIHAHPARRSATSIARQQAREAYRKMEAEKNA
jgi:hypothetical protein